MKENSNASASIHAIPLIKKKIDIWIKKNHHYNHFLLNIQIFFSWCLRFFILNYMKFHYMYFDISYFHSFILFFSLGGQLCFHQLDHEMVSQLLTQCIKHVHLPYIFRECFESVCTRHNVLLKCPSIHCRMHFKYHL